MLNFKSINSICIGVLVAISIVEYFYGFTILPYLILGGFWLCITTIGSFNIQWNYYIKSLNYNSKTTKNQVAITFDDGPNPEFTPQVLTLLNKYNAKATFFCIGKQVEKHPNIIKAILKENHSIGNHTYSHANSYGFYKTKKVISDLQLTNKIIEAQTNLKLKLFRPAFGVTNPRIKRALKATKLKAIGWNKRSLDTTNLNQKTILNRITKNLKKGDVILLHDTSAKSIAVLEQLLLFLQQQKIESVTIDTLFNIEAYV
ncbi:MAG: polysaccharide deacetylase family protein [Oceanihabitans sp.]